MAKDKRPSLDDIFGTNIQGAGYVITKTEDKPSLDKIFGEVAIAQPKQEQPKTNEWGEPVYPFTSPVDVEGARLLDFMTPGIIEQKSNAKSESEQPAVGIEEKPYNPEGLLPVAEAAPSEMPQSFISPKVFEEYTAEEKMLLDVDKATDLAFENAQKEANKTLAEELAKSPIRGNAMGGELVQGIQMAGSIRKVAGADAVIKSVFESISADDVNAIIDEKVKNNPEFKAQKQAFDEEIKKLIPESNNNLSDSDVEVILSQLSPEEREAAEKKIAETTQAIEALQEQFAQSVADIYSTEGKAVEGKVYNQIISRLAKLNIPKSDLEYIGKAIYNNSLMGTLYELAVTGASGGSGTDYMVSQQALAMANPSAIAKVVGGAGAILVDTGIFGALGAGGSLVGGAVRSVATRAVAGQIARKAAVSATNKAVKQVATRIVEKNVLQQFATAAISQGLTLGSYNGLLTAAQETLSPTGENGAFNWRNVFHRFEEGLATGAAVGSIAVGTAAAKGAMYRARPDMAYTAKGMAADVGVGLAGFTAENLAFVGLGSLISGEEFTVEALGESFATLGVLKGVGALKRIAKGEKLMQQPDFSDLKFTKEEMDAMRKAGVDMEAMDFISLAVTEMNNVPYTESRRSVINAYNTVMASREIPTSAKVKLKYIVTGEMPKVVGPSRAEVVEGENGVEVRTYDYQDRLVQIRPFENTESATKFVSRIQPLLEQNIIVDGAKTLRGADSLIAIDRAIDEYMKSDDYLLEKQKVDATPHANRELYSKESLLRMMRIYLGIEQGTLPEGSEPRIAIIVSLAKNVYQDSVSALQSQVAKQHGTTVAELERSINVKPDLRTVRESQLVKAYVDGLKQFNESMSGPIQAEQARYSAQVQPQIEQGTQEVVNTERETQMVRQSIEEAAKRMATSDGKQIAIVRLSSGEEVAVYKGRIVVKDNGEIDTTASENTVVVKRIDADGNEKRDMISIDNVAEVVEFSSADAAVDEAMSAIEAVAVKKQSLDNALVKNGEQGVEVVAAGNVAGKVVGIDENGLYIFRSVSPEGKEVDVPISINEITEVNTELPTPATAEQGAAQDAVEKVVDAAEHIIPEVVYDDDFPPLTEDDLAPAINPDNIQWDKLSQEEYADVSAMVMGDATTLADSHIYHTNSRAKLAKAKQSVAEQQKVIDKLNSRFATLSSPAEAQKLRKQVAAAEQEKAKREQAVKNIEEQMAKYAHAMRKYGVEVATEDSLLAERARLEEERNALLEADKELDRYEQQEATKGKKAIANTAANRKYIEQLYADRFGVSPAQAGPRQAILWDLANGAIKLRWDNVTTDSGAVQKGLAAELGLTGSTGDRRAYKAVIDNKNGQSVDAYAHDLWQGAEWGQEVDDMTLKDMILNILQSTPNGSIALKELADMSGVQADLEAQISLGKGDIQRKLEEVEANLAKNAQQMVDFRKRINDTVQKLENGEHLIIPIGEGEFGPIYDQFRGKPQEAVDFLLAEKNGEAIGALSHKDIGEIDLVWGKEGTGHSDGYGLSKLAKYHPEVLDKLQPILDDMEVVSRNTNRVNLESPKYQAAVRLTWNNERKNWLLTAFEKRNSAIDNTTDTGETAINGKQNDTATLQSTASESKDTTSIPKNQISEEEIYDNAPVSEDIPKVLSLEQYLGELGLSSPMSDYMIDKTRQPHLRTQSQKNKFEKDAKEAMLTYAQQREQAIVDYKKLVDEGRITPPSNIDRLIASAHGHNDLESTQAARRQLAKRGIDWESGLPKEAPFMIEQKPTEKPMDTAEQAFIRERVEIISDLASMGPNVVTQTHEEIKQTLSEYKAGAEELRTAIVQNAEIAAERAEIERVAKDNGTWLKAPNGQDTNLSPKQWVDVRTKAFKEWFGDWELASKIVDIIKIENAIHFSNIAEAKRWAKANIVGVCSNPEIGDVNISKESINKYLSEKAVKQSTSLGLHLSCLQKMPSIINSSIVGEIHKDKNNDKNILDIVRLYGCVTVDGDLCRVKTTVKRYVDANLKTKAYSYEVTEIELLDGSLEAHTHSVDSSTTSNNSITGAKLLKGVKKSNSNEEILSYSKVLDANGGPMVVYHGTPNQFNTFNRELIGSSTDRGIWGRGFYFTSNKAEAERYTKRGDATGKVKEVFLNIRKPLVIKAEQGDAGKEYIQSLYRKHVTDEIFEDPRTTDAKLAEATQKVTDELVENGYDGVVVTYKDGTQEYVVFNPNQIKSATENIGTYSADNADIRFAIEAYHGSGADFEKFDHSFMGTGEGAQAFGWGTYVTEAENIAKRYARASGESKERKERELAKQTLLIIRENIAQVRMFIDRKQKELAAMEEHYAKLEGDLQATIFQRNRKRLQETMEELANDIRNAKGEIEASQWQIEQLKPQEAQYAKLWDQFDAPRKIEELKNRIEWAKLDIRNLNYKIEQHAQALDKLEQSNETSDQVLEDLRSILNFRYLLEGKDAIGAKAAIIAEIERYKGLIEDAERGISNRQKELEELQAIEQPKYRNLYSVEVPDNTGGNYLSWDKDITAEQKRVIYPKMAQVIEDKIEKLRNSQDAENLKGHIAGWENVLATYKQGTADYKGETLYRMLISQLGSDKAASELLHSLGFTGIEYPAQYTTGGRADGAKNYVIFNADDVKIVEHIQYLKTPQGIVYGFTIGDTSYIDIDELNPETPVHEYTEWWSKIVAKNNPKLWARGKELLKETDTWKEVNEDPNYKDLSEDLRASETLSRIAAKEAGKKMSEVSDNKSLIAKLRAWIRKFWGDIKATFAKWSKKDLQNLTVNQFSHMPLRDLFEGVDLRKYRNAKVKSHKQAQLDIIKKHNPMQDDVHTGIRKVEDIKSFDEVLGESRKNQAEYGELTYPDMNIDMMESAAESGMITVYSSYPIKQGVFVTPSYMNAQDYAGGSGRVYQATVPVDDVAWIAEDEGQYARVETEPMRPMIVGEKGAANLDAMEEATTRLDNLTVAREMEEVNRDAKAIKLATGWERGADGKWRYEIPDFKLKSDTTLAKNEDNQIVTTLGEVIDDEALFTAFPELRKLSVVSLPNQEYGGHYQDGSIMPHIALGNKLFTPSTRRLVELEKEFDKDMSSEQEDALMSEFNAEVERAVAQPEFYTLVTSAAKKVLVHEVQHAIQRIEGFARGGSWELERPDNDAEMLRLRDAVRDARAYIDHFKGDDIAMAIRDGKKYNYLEWRSISPESQQILLEYLGRKRKVNYADFRAYLDNAHKMTLPKQYGMSGYRKFAGEVESRNAEARMYMTPEERRATLLSETEDVAREEQIFLENNLGVAQSVEVTEPVEATTRKPRKPKEEKLSEKIEELKGRLNDKKKSLDNTLTDIYTFLTSTDVANTMGEGVGKAQYRKVIKNSIEAIKKAYSVTDPAEKRKIVDKYLTDIDDSLSQLLSRQRLNEVTDILDTAIYGYTAQGVRTGKRIDEHTREIFDILRDAIGEPIEEERTDDGRKKPVRYRLKNRTEDGDITSSFRLRTKIDPETKERPESIMERLRREADKMIDNAEKLTTQITSKAVQLEYTANVLERYDNTLVLNEAIGQSTEEINRLNGEIERVRQELRAAPAGSDQRKSLQSALDEYKRNLTAEQQNRANLRHRYAAQLKVFTTTLEQLDDKGAAEFAREELAKAEERIKWRKGIYDSVKNPEAPVLPVEGKSRNGEEQKINWKGLNTRAKINASPFMATFAEMSRDIDINSIPGQWNRSGWYYQFILAPGGYMERTDWRYKTEKSLLNELDDAVVRFTGKSKFWDKFKAVSGNPLNVLATAAQEKSGLSIQRMAVSTNKNGRVVGGYQENIPLTIGNILYMRNAIRQPNGMAGYTSWGLSETWMQNVANYAETHYPEYCKFFDWVVGDFLPKLYDMQDAIYFKKFGTHLPKTAFYFPFVRDKRMVGKIAEVGEGEVSLPSSVTGNIVERVKTSAKMDLTADAFKVLQDHMQETLNWCAYSELTDKFNSVATSHAFNNILKAQGVSPQKFKEVFEIAVGQGKINSTENTGAVKLLNAASKGIVAGNIVLNLNAAAKQIVSGTATLGYTANPKILPIWAKNFFVPSAIHAGVAKIVQKIKGGEINPVEVINWKVVGNNWKWAIENIPTLRERWEGRDVGFEVLKSHSWETWDKVTSMLTSIGLSPNAFVDMMTCSNCARTVYEYEYPRLLERGRSKEDAHREACVKAAVFVNETQQSSLDGFLSSFQSGGGLQRLLGVGLGAYQNSSMAFARNERFAATNMLRMLKPTTKQDMIARQVEAYKADGVDDSKAYALAKSDFNESYGAQASSFIHNAILNNYFWAIAGAALTPLLSAGIAALFNDKDEWKKVWKNEKFRQELATAVSAETLVWQAPLLYNAPITKQLLTYSKNAADGKTWGGIFESPASADAQDLIDAMFQQWVGVKNDITGDRETKEPKSWDRSAEWLVVNALIKAGLGVNLNLVARVAEGVKGMVEDGEANAEDVMAILSSPRGLTRAIAGEPRAGESKQDYLDRMSYIYRQVNAGSGKYDKKFVTERTKEYIDNKDNALYRDLGIAPRDVRVLEQRIKAIRKQLLFFDKSDEGVSEFRALSKEEKQQQIEIAKRYDKVSNLTKKLYQGIQPFDEQGMASRKKELSDRYQLMKEVYDMWIEYNNK